MSNHNYDYDVIVLGSGPGGYVAAIRAAQLGLKTALVERENLGGVCLNWGCIPTKALIHNAEVLETLHSAKDFGFTFENLTVDFSSAVKRSRDIADRQAKGVNFLMRKNKIDVIEGHGRFVDPHTLHVEPSEFKPEAGERDVTAAHFIVAVGARARGLPGIEIDGERIIQYRDALVMENLPEKLVVVGSGAIGMEFSYLYNTYGVDVTVVEMLDQLLPLEDPEVSAEVQKEFRRKGIKTLVSTRTEGVEITDQGVKVTVRNLKNDEVQELNADKVLMAIGIQPNTDKAGLDAAGVELDQRGYIQIDEVMRTNVPHIYAIGDCTGKLALAHVASAQGIVAAETIAGVETLPIPHEKYIFMPRCTYCQPQVASLGMTEAQAKEAGYQIKVGKFPFMPNGKARALEAKVGFVKIIADAKYGEILGAHLVGPDVTELLPELSLAQFMEITPAEIARTVHAHPTLSEVIMEAAHAVEGHPIHM
ncbi:dihydrolipoyl dehydrogenase [Litorilinea aerophila]|uniref:Dihydrolipoyl dehydrogenase n=1 Tax=Litorilinea aerophila TaxID=1204385 RepID=A0A540VFT4_9CHLR|nr:dihydrolipoyl dehydrogenase [Litorilinea aerophila]MCC9077302.1 dihydrolipoyl dehydrogenase [Litorilinea aerophila]OUC07198.1 dihydrolipoamide dehydrogenase [Litorilinea aerophila]GIV79452.1 MAG: dihydrolipoyl dehydrogenase [Litorilinea sp.]